jgi:uncharacterized protein involved in exopolysaccharide biosynthesis
MIDVTARIAGADEPAAPLPAAPRSGTAILPVNGLLSSVRRRWVSFVVPVIVAFGVATAYMSLATPVYQSRCRLHVERLGAAALDPPATNTSVLNTQAEVLRSRPTLELFLESPAGKQLRSVAQEARPVEFLQRELSVRVDKATESLTLALESPSPDEALGMLKGVVEAYFARQSGRRLRESGALLRVLERDLERTRGELQARLASLDDLPGDGAPNEDNEGTLTANGTEEDGAALEPSDVQRRLRALGDKLTQASLERISLQRDALADEAAGDEAGQGAHGAAPVVDDLAEAENGTDTSVEPASAAALAPAGESQAVRQNPAVRRVQLAREKERVLEQALERERRMATDLLARSPAHRLLESDVQRLERACARIEGRIQEARLARDWGRPVLSVLEPVRATEQPVWPRESRVMAMALVLGSLTGVCAVAWREWFSQPEGARP